MRLLGRRRRAGTVAVRRSSGSARRRPTIRRSSAGFGRTRAIALFVALVSALAIYGLSASSAFGYRRLDLAGAVRTDEVSVRAELGLSAGQNLVALTTDGIADRLRRLPAVTDATIGIGLPDTVRIELTERRPIAIWQTAQRRLLVDADRMAFALAGTAAGLPTVDDRRVASATLGVGDAIDPVDFDAATRLASLRPADLGSSAAAIHVTLSDEQGFVVDDGSNGWTAIFGFYTPTLRRPDLIPGQVRLLGGLLAGREGQIATVILADDRNGTFTLKPAP